MEQHFERLEQTNFSPYGFGTENFWAYQSISPKPTGDFNSANYDSLGYRTGDTSRTIGNFTTIGFNVANFRATDGAIVPVGNFIYHLGNYQPENFFCEVSMVNVSDSGTGSDAVAAISVSFTISDTSSGSESIAETSSFTVSDSGAASEADIIIGLPVADSGSGADVWQYPSATFTVSETGSGSESVGLTVSFTITDPGTGSDLIGMTNNFTVADSGSGSETLLDITVNLTITQTNAGRAESVGIENDVMVSQTGTGSDNITLTNNFTVSDSGAKQSETAGIVVSLTVSQTGAGSETITLVASFTVSQTGSGVDVWTVGISIPAVDSGSGFDIVTDRGIGIIDPALGAEYAWRLEGFVMLDSLQLPHVQRIRINDDGAVSEKMIQGGALPVRDLIGKRGRVVEIEGWTTSQTDIDEMEALVDGTPHTFIHPSGDSFAVLVTRFEPDRQANEYNERTYRLTLVEVE